jgi:hypothetical protein
LRMLPSSCRRTSARPMAMSWPCFTRSVRLWHNAIMGWPVNHRTCAACGESFVTSVIIDGKRRDFSARTRCLACSPFVPKEERRRKKTCLKCGKSFPTRVVIGGEVRDLWIRKYCLDCSPFGTHTSRQLELVRTDGLKTCGVCKHDLSVETAFGKHKRYGQPDAPPIVDSVCLVCRAKQAKSVRNAMKRRCVEYLGGRCSKCGYNRCLASLDFHHTDPVQKDFEIGRMRGRDFKTLRPELDKCVLLCRNCHGEEHADEDLFIDDLSQTAVGA